MKNKKNALKVLFLIVFCFGSISIKILNEQSNIEVEEFLTYQEIDYTLKKDNESMMEFELKQAKEFFNGEETTYPKKTMIKSLNIDIYEYGNGYEVLDHNAKTDAQYESLEQVFDYIESKTK